MRTRVAFLIFVSFIAVMVGLFWFHQGNENKSLANREDNPIAGTNRTSNEPETNIERNTEVKAAKGVPLQPGPPDLNMKLSDLYFGPVDVYGKVADQNDSPVPNATVYFLVDRSIYDVASSIKGSVAADSKGLFHIGGYEGSAVGLRPEATGYVLAEINPRVIIKNAEPPAKNYISDPNNPMTIKMWKNQGAEALVSVTKEIEFVPMNRPIHLIS